MDKLIHHLQAQARSHPSSRVLQRILSQFRFLLNGVRVDSPDVRKGYEDLQRDLGMLATEGMWRPSKEDEDALRDLRKRLGLSREHAPDVHPETTSVEDREHGAGASVGDDGIHSLGVHNDTSPQSSPGPPEGRPDISIVQPPPLSTPLLPVSTHSHRTLPIELLQTLNHTFFLHLLATDPERVLPPGKSLLSMMSAPRTTSGSLDGDLPKLEERVKDVVHRAFWKEVRAKIYPL